MGRPLRIEYSGAFYHVTSRGNERRDIFKNNRDRERFLAYLESATVRYGARIHVYCLMTNHYHLLVETPLGNLSEIMRHVNGAYTNYFNTKRRRFGHLLQGRYKAILVEKDAYALELSRYIHLNPVRARIVERPEEYAWSSYRSYVGEAQAPPWLQRRVILEPFGNAQGIVGEGYRRFVASYLDGEGKDPMKEVVGSTMLGSDGFVEWAKETFLKNKSADRDLPAVRSLSHRPSIEEIRAAVELAFEGDRRLARRATMFLCHQLSGCTLLEIGATFGVGPSGVTQASRRLAEEVSSSPNLGVMIEGLRQKLKM